LSWRRATIIAAKRETRGQRLTLVYNPDEPNEEFELDVFLVKAKAGVLWRFVKPAEKVQLDWAGVAQRAAATAPAAPAKAAPSKGKRKAPSAPEVCITGACDGHSSLRSEAVRFVIAVPCTCRFVYRMCRMIWPRALDTRCAAHGGSVLATQLLSSAQAAPG
jgi:hypothetical protein